MLLQFAAQEKRAGKNSWMSSGETGSFRKEGLTEQVSFNFFLLNLYRPLGEPDLSKAPAFFLRREVIALVSSSYS